MFEKPDEHSLKKPNDELNEKVGKLLDSLSFDLLACLVLKLRKFGIILMGM